MKKKIYWEMCIDNGKREEHLIRDNGDNSFTILGIARTQKQFNILNKKYSVIL